MGKNIDFNEIGCKEISIVTNKNYRLFGSKFVISNENF